MDHINEAALPREPDPTSPVLVVGLGASAGGIQALQEFFRGVTPDIGAAYVVVLHLSPEHESRLADVLQAVASIPVTRVTQTLRVERDHVYVISPNTSLRMADGLLTVSDTLRAEERRAPVDIFFRTLADTHGHRAACIVLSGTGPNGSNGLKRIKEQGGLVIAQDPDECQHPDMPRNAIATDLVDHVLAVGKMPAKVQALARQLGPRADNRVEVHLKAIEPLPEILTLVRLRTGHDFSHYKAATVLRRIDRRQHVHQLPDLPAYASFLQEHPDEVLALQAELLISVTQFFRDGDAYSALERSVVPHLFEKKTSTEQIRVWVAGCATGEEAYSIAMLLVEAAAKSADPPGIQVFATDLDGDAIAEGREGFYTAADVADVSSERLRRFFSREPAGYRVKRELRELVLFAPHNVLKDPPFSHLDLVCCRNVLIYLNRPAQERLIQTFHFALRPGGYLFLGTSESPDGTGELFAVVDKSAHIYDSRAVMARALPPLGDGLGTTVQAGKHVHRGERRERISSGELHVRLLEQFAPPSIVVSDEHQVVHVSEHAGEYLQVGSGEISRDVMHLIRPELRVELRTALYRAARESVNVEVRGVPVTIEGERRHVNITVRPLLRDNEPARGFLLVLLSRDDSAREPAHEVPTVQLRAPVISDAARQLEEEVTRLKTQLRDTVDQYETQAEEARASNEELQAVNEELLSSAEELETSKEELQSVNEELTTVNQELKVKIEELALSNDNFQNLINSTEIGTIFLDSELRLKLSTPRVRDVFNLLPADAGRPLSDITTSLEYVGLPHDAQHVLEHLQTIEREVTTREGRWYLVRLLPYRTADQRIEGVVITFLDITERRLAVGRVRASEERLRLLLDSLKDYAILTITPEGRIDSWNAAAQRMFGYPEAEFIGLPFAALFTPEDRERGVAEEALRSADRAGRAQDERWHVRKDGTLLLCSGVLTPLGESDRRGYVKIARDVTTTRENELALTRARSELEDRVRQTHDLEVQLELRTGGERRVAALVRRLVTAQEEERARIARDIHDVVGQQLTVLRLAIERHAGRAGALASDDGDLNRALQIVSDVDRQLDFLAWELRPAVLDDLGLTVALSRYVQSWSAHFGVQAEFRAVGLDANRLSPETETEFYRISQEALHNVAKHSHATRVDVIVERRDDEVVLIIEDDGVGFATTDDTSGMAMGLASMRERAAVVGARFIIESSPGEGTTVFVRQAASRGAADG
jgi:two-component system CheB/CheR fusion protein